MAVIGEGLIACPWSRIAAPFHFLHHDFVIRQHHNAKTAYLVTRQSRYQASERRIQGGDAFRKAEPTLFEALNHFSGFALVNFHVRRTPAKSLAVI